MDAGLYAVLEATPKLCNAAVITCYVVCQERVLLLDARKVDLCYLEALRKSVEDAKRQYSLAVLNWISNVNDKHILDFAFHADVDAVEVVSDDLLLVQEEF